MTYSRILQNGVIGLRTRSSSNNSNNSKNRFVRRLRCAITTQPTAPVIGNCSSCTILREYSVKNDDQLTIRSLYNESSTSTTNYYYDNNNTKSKQQQQQNDVINYSLLPRKSSTARRFCTGRNNNINNNNQNMYHNSTMFQRYNPSLFTFNQIQYQNINQQQQYRYQSTSWTSYLPEVVQDYTIWGGSGYILRLLHNDLPWDNIIIPYWGGFIIISLAVRTILIPVVIWGAKTSSRFAVIIPELQFILSLFQNDMKQLRHKQIQDKIDTSKERWNLMKLNLKTISGIYKLHNIKPYAIFLSPLLQLPFFYYISIDLRKIVNGLDPELAQQLVDTSIGWISDLTEPDPWYGLPILSGLILYTNLEVAIGRRNLAGSSASKTDTAMVMKDVFQTLAIFMPCFTSQLPSGVQIYIVTSFVFTTLQSMALRNDTVRTSIGLPLLSAPPKEPIYAKQFIELKQLEQKAREYRTKHNTPVYGKHGILDPNYEISFPGLYRTSTIQCLKIQQEDAFVSPLDGENSTTTITKPVLKTDFLPREIQDMPYLHGISAPLSQLIKQFHEQEKQQQEKQQQQQLAKMDNIISINNPESQDVTTTTKTSTVVEYVPTYDDEIIAKANRGENPNIRIVPLKSASESITIPTKVSLKRFEKKKKNTSSKPKKKR